MAGVGPAPGGWRHHHRTAGTPRLARAGGGRSTRPHRVVAWRLSTGGGGRSLADRPRGPSCRL